MPNWVENAITIDSKYRDYIVNSKGEVDFGIIFPMPESLQVEAGGSNDTDIYVYLSERMTKTLEDVRKDPLSKLIHNQFSNDWLKEISERITDSEKDPEEIEKAYQRGSVLINNYKEYGAINWYNWCVANWGTKWNASDTEIWDDTISFNTAWSSPTGWLSKLAALKIPFTLEWEEEQGYYGEYTSNGDGNLYETESGFRDPWGDEDDEEDEEE